MLLRDLKITLYITVDEHMGLPVREWYDVTGEKTLSDAILDRLVHDVHRIELVGESLRRKQTTKNLKDFEQVEENN